MWPEAVLHDMATLFIRSTSHQSTCAGWGVQCTFGFRVQPVR